MTYVVRAGEHRDREAALALAPRLAEGVASWRDPDRVHDAVAGWVGDCFDHLGDEERAVFVAESAGTGVVGVATVEVKRHWTGERDTYLGALAVDPRSESRGVGRALVATATVWARERGHGRLVLDTGAANTRARRFYAGLGFVEEDIKLTLRL